MRRFIERIAIVMESMRSQHDQHDKQQQAQMELLTQQIQHLKTQVNIAKSQLTQEQFDALQSELRSVSAELAAKRDENLQMQMGRLFFSPCFEICPQLFFEGPSHVQQQILMQLSENLPRCDRIKAHWNNCNRKLRNRSN